MPRHQSINKAQSRTLSVICHDFLLLSAFSHRYSRSHLQSCPRTIKKSSPVIHFVTIFSTNANHLHGSRQKRFPFSVVEKFRFPKPSARPRQKILEIPFVRERWKCLFKSFNTVAAIFSFLSPATRSKFLCLY